MSNDLINQITLNYLISKQQLEKLNKSKENPENKHRQKREIYKERIIDLFTNMLDGTSPDGLLMEVKRSFDYYVDNCIYYFEVHDNHIDIEQKRKGIINVTQCDHNQNENNEDHDNVNQDEDEDRDEDEDQDEDEDDCQDEDQDQDQDEDQDDCQDDIDYHDENDDNYIQDNDNDVYEEITTNKEKTTLKTIKSQNGRNDTHHEKYVYPKKKSAISEGVENINQLPLDWFTKIKKQNELKKSIKKNTT